MTLWAKEWKRPQAVEWERNGQFLEVAMFVRSLADAEKASASTSARILVRQLMDALGLTTAGLRANRWRIGEPDAIKPKRPARPALSARDRLRVVPPDDPEVTA